MSRQYILHCAYALRVRRAAQTLWPQTVHWLLEWRHDSSGLNFWHPRPKSVLILLRRPIVVRCVWNDFLTIFCFCSNLRTTMSCWRMNRERHLSGTQRSTDQHTATYESRHCLAARNVLDNDSLQTLQPTSITAACGGKPRTAAVECTLQIDVDWNCEVDSVIGIDTETTELGAEASSGIIGSATCPYMEKWTVHGIRRNQFLGIEDAAVGGAVCNWWRLCWVHSEFSGSCSSSSEVVSQQAAIISTTRPLSQMRTTE